MIKKVNSYSYYLTEKEKELIVYEIHKKGLSVPKYLKTVGVQAPYFNRILNGIDAVSKKMYEKAIKPLNVNIRIPEEFK